jgi:two-component system, sporulation sensor kinase D
MNVELTIQYNRDKLPISFVKDHIKQVILNLAKNSLQAMPNGGKLTITLQKRLNDCLNKGTTVEISLPLDTECHSA